MEIPNIFFIFVLSNFKTIYFMWIFDYFKKKKEERARLLEENRRKMEDNLRKEKLRYNERKLYIDDFVNKLNFAEHEKEMESVKSHNDCAKKRNSMCPNCCSKDIVHKFKRQKGEIHGSIDGENYSSHSGFLFGSSSYQSGYVNGKIDGNLDTLKVNKCNHCGNEWEIMEEKLYLSSKDYYLGKIDWKFNTNYFIKSCMFAFDKIDEFNPSRLDEDCNTIEEKIEQQVNYIKEKCCYDHTKELPLEVLYYYARKYDYELSLYNKNKIFAPTKNMNDVDKYMGRFHNRLEKFLIEHFGFKYHFSE